MTRAVSAIALAGVMSLFVISSAAAQSHSGHTMIVPSELKWADVPSLPAGAQIVVIEGPMNEAKPITARIKFPANYKLPAHTHPVIEHVTVLSGTFNMGAGDKLDTAQTKALTAGGFAIMHPGTPHFAWTSEETSSRSTASAWGVTYVNPADDPRKK